MRDRTGEAVEFPHYDGIEAPAVRVGHEAVKLGALLFAAGDPHIHVFTGNLPAPALAVVVFKVAGMGPRALAQEIVDRSKGEKIGAIYLSPDAFAKRTSEDTIAEQLGDIFVANGLPRPIQADNDRKGGWMLMYELLRAGEWQIGDNCTALIESLPMLTRDDKKVEDCLEFKGDDAADATRYALKSRLRARKPPLEERVEHELAKLPAATSPHGRAMQIQRIVREQTKKPKAIFIGRRGWRKRLKWSD